MCVGRPEKKFLEKSQGVSGVKNVCEFTDRMDVILDCQITGSGWRFSPAQGSVS